MVPCSGKLLAGTIVPRNQKYFPQLLRIHYTLHCKIQKIFPAKTLLQTAIMQWVSEVWLL